MARIFTDMGQPQLSGANEDAVLQAIAEAGGSTDIEVLSTPQGGQRIRNNGYESTEVTEEKSDNDKLKQYALIGGSIIGGIILILVILYFVKRKKKK